MKLISLYIENFGGLHRYSLDFEHDLTVIEEANGFGKTTLAEFIRAMFYGFPRKAKTLDKSLRQKYTPWNGGKFGGNLVFEADGNRYRVERSFGATPKGDSFALIDLATNKKSTRYSEDLGLELFQLDAESFERSTYLPQMSDGQVLTTDSIRSKLSNLVEDTNDVGNFEKAMAALKARRTTFVPYRGSGGSVMQANSRVSQLQEQLRMAESQQEVLERTLRRTEELRQEQEEKENSREQVRQEIRRASEAAAAAAIHQQHDRLQEKAAAIEKNCNHLLTCYPAGIPEAGSIEQAREAAAQLEILNSRTVTEQEDLDAQAFLEENRSRFETHIPTPEELAACRSRCSKYLSVRAEMESKGLTDEETALYEQLKPRFEAGELEESRLDALSENCRERMKKCHERDNLTVAEEDALKIAELECYFASGVPDEETLTLRQQEQEEMLQLSQKNTELAASIAQRTPVKASPLLLIIFLLLGAAGTALGILLLVQQEFLWGGIALGAGILALVGAIFAGVRLILAKRQRIALLPDQEKLRTNEEKIEGLKQNLDAFVEQFTQTQPLSAALYEIWDNREDYLALKARREAIEEKQRRLDEEISEMEEKLTGELGEGDYEEAILQLRMARERCLRLRRELQQAQEEIAKLDAKAAAVKEDIVNFLAAYGPVEGVDFYGQLAELEHSSEDYLRAKNRVAQWQREKAAHEEELARWNGVLAAFFEGAGLMMEQNTRSQLLQIRDDRKDWEELQQEAGQARRELEEFRQANSHQLSLPVPENLADPEELKQAETALTARITVCSEELLRQQQRKDLLQSQVQQIPAILDELQLWQEKKIADQKKSDLLDVTMAMLEQAQENLSKAYLGPIRESFAGYLGKLWAEQESQILVTPDLDVQLERYGAARELGYFSAGQTDMVMLCMRFALVDALFGSEKPFVILDDPFINLDDGRTAQALELLQLLAQDRQILYLTCNSSRAPQ